MSSSLGFYWCDYPKANGFSPCYICWCWDYLCSLTSSNGIFWDNSSCVLLMVTLFLLLYFFLTPRLFLDGFFTGCRCRAFLFLFFICFFFYFFFLLYSSFKDAESLNDRSIPLWEIREYIYPLYSLANCTRSSSGFFSSGASENSSNSSTMWP